MTPDQAIAFVILGGTIALFIHGRLPYDLVALLSLFAAVMTGVVPAEKAFSGFSDDVVIIVAGALLVSAAVARSGAVEAAMRPLLPWMQGGPAVQVPILAAVVMVLSAVTKNVGALAIMMPVAFQLAKRTGTPASALLMPMAFAALLGGLVTLVGTSPNIIVSRLRQEITGTPFGMFDFAPVGLCIALAGLVVLALGWRLLPRGQKGGGSKDAAFTIDQYTTEARLPKDSPHAGKTVAALEALGEGAVRIAVIIRAEAHRLAPVPGRVLQAEDRLLLEGEAEDLDSFVARGGLTLEGERQKLPEDAAQVVEGVVTSESPLVGMTPAGFDLHRRSGLSLIAVSRRGQRIAEKLSDLRLRAGDVVILRGDATLMTEAMGGLRVLPLSERNVQLGRSRRGWLPPLVLAVAMALVALNWVPVAIAFFGAAVLLLALRTLTMREAYETVEWPVVVLLAALIPVSEAIRTTGGTDLVAGWLSGTAQALPPLAALALIMVIAMAVTPFLNNAATVLVMAPVGASLAQQIGLSPDPFLMAVAIGAACDFLTPIGHQCNTLVMGPGGYRFGDYWRLGLPLSVTVVLVGVPAIAFFWPLE
ncbi:SLC13 family permease [Falsiroseomonas tokyonensis]|uniref:SLC13 family permease n=1 Tax=Falsiroseomonas tokyonensis TaxID=430521 RepID=A0ABV7BXL6_9PROT|nr:SLC13 family permease [Falsiroseomonas tokyonensis]MBU8539619.1 SLC13 family permease [Falsiroseomonas tokyonensis]